MNTLINKELYCQFLIAAQGRFTVTTLAELFNNHPAHDSYTRWLTRIKLKPRILWEYAQSMIDKNSGYLVVDDTVLDKWHGKMIEPVQYQYSGNHHRQVYGIGVVNLLWNKHLEIEKAEHIPIDFRLFDKARDGKKKTKHCSEMIQVAYNRGIRNITILADSAYSSLATLRLIEKLDYHFVIGLKSNRLVSLPGENNHFCHVSTIANSQGVKCFLKEFGFVKVLEMNHLNGDIKYVATNDLSSSSAAIRKASNRRWRIEELHRGEKQTIGIQGCQFRSQRAQRNHILCSTLAFLAIEKYRLETGRSWYESKHRIIADALRAYLEKPFIPLLKNALTH